MFNSGLFNKKEYQHYHHLLQEEKDISWFDFFYYFRLFRSYIWNIKNNDISTLIFNQEIDFYSYF